MDENVKNNIFYRPELEIERNYYSQGSFNRPAEEIVTPETDLDELTNKNKEVRNSLVSIYNVLECLPDKIAKVLKDITETLIFQTVIEEETGAGLPPSESEEINQPVINDELYLPKGDYVIDEDGFVWGEQQPTGIEIEISKVRPSHELALEQYILDSTNLKELFVRDLTHVIQKYLCNIVEAVNECGLDGIEYLNLDYEGKSVKSIGLNSLHLNDTIVKSQALLDEKVRLFEKTHCPDNTEEILSNLDIIAQERIRYLKEEYDLEINSALDIAKRDLLRARREQCEKDYYAAKMNVYKYFNSTVKLAESLLDTATDNQQSKAILLTENIDIFAHEKYETTGVSNAANGEAQAIDYSDSVVTNSSYNATQATNTTQKAETKKSENKTLKTIKDVLLE